MVVYGEKRLEKISKKLSLPYWWIQSVVIEYFPCRRFLEDGELWTFDFDLFDDNLISSIPEKKVVIPEYYIAQNVTPKQVSERILSTFSGQKISPLKKEDADPEGFINETAFPFLGNPIDVWDPKLGFHKISVINDNGRFFVWHIAELYNINEKSSWHKSDLFGLTPLWEVYAKLMSLRKNEILKNPTVEHRKLAEKYYTEYEKTRIPLREIIWNYHLQKQQQIEGINNQTDYFTIFETIIKDDNTKITRTNLEPIFYRSAIRNKELAKISSERSVKEYNQQFTYDEIEYSIMSIISSINCLEAFINSLNEQYILNINPMDRIRDKWKNVAKKLIPNIILNDQDSFKTFSKFVDWRNDVVHYKFHYKTTVDDRILIHDRYNYENAELATNLIRIMVSLFTNYKEFKSPLWLEQTYSFDSGSPPTK
jgi:hypothetical protein